MIESFHKKETVVKPSIIRKSVLPTINGGVEVLNTVYGGTTTSISPQPFDKDELVNYQNVLGTLITTESNYIVRNNPQYVGQGSIIGVNNQFGDNAIDVTYSTKPNNNTQLIMGNNINNLQVQGSIMGVNGRVGDNAADVTYSTKPNISTQYDIQGGLMGVNGGIGDNAVDVTYSTKPNINNNNLAIKTFNPIVIS